MSKISLLNREPNFRNDTCQRISDKGVICENISKENIKRISIPFEELKKDNKTISSTDDLSIASSRVRERDRVRKRVLQRQKEGGFILISSLTCMGTLAAGSLIFMAIKYIIME